MNRWNRPVVRVVQVGLVVAALAVAFRVHRGAAAESSGLEMSLSVLGETDGADGSRHPVDLLAHPDRSADRYQVAVTPTRASRVMVDEIIGGQERRLYPAQGQAGVLNGGRTYALPGTGSFFDRGAATRVRVTVVPLNDEGALSEAEPFGAPGVDSLQLSDSKPQVVSSRLFHAPHGGTVEVALH